MPPKSLVQLCTQVCIRYANVISDLGDMPFSRARPILLRVESASQLHEIELNSPHLVADTPEIWRRLIAKHFPQWEKKNYVPKNPASWHKVYARYKKEQEQELAEAEARLKDAFAVLESQKESRQSKIVEQRLLPPPPKDGRGVRRPGGGGGGADLPSHLSFGGGSRTRLTDGQSFLKKARREAREIANRRALSTPTGQLPVRAGQIVKAPAAMLHEHRVKQQPTFRIHAPRSCRHRPAACGGVEDAEARQREARLMRIKNAAAPRPEQVVVSDSEDGSDDLEGAAAADDEEEEAGLASLFGDDEQEVTANTSSKKTASVATTSWGASASPARHQKRPGALSRVHKGSGLLTNSHRADGRKLAPAAPGRNTTSSQAGPSPPLNPSSRPSRRTPNSPERGERRKQSSPESAGRSSTAKSTARTLETPSVSPPLKPHPTPAPHTTTLANSPDSALRKRKSTVDIFFRPKKIQR